MKNSLDDMFNKLMIENAVVETDFKHQFDRTSVSRSKNESSSPYQTLRDQQDRIAQISDGYKFLNGKLQGEYENEQLQKIQIPGITDRF